MAWKHWVAAAANDFPRWISLLSMGLERACTIAVAVLLYRLHDRMSKAQNFEAFLRQGLATEKLITKIIIALLALAFIGSVVSESFLIANEDDSFIYEE